MTSLRLLRRSVLAAIALVAAGVLWSVDAQAPTPRSEHPRPDFVRQDWQTLNGMWEFEFDDRDDGLRAGWYSPEAARFSRTILVPYAFQSSLSGIHDTAFHDVVWYRRRFAVPPAWRERRVLLNFGAVDYEATVWVNGLEVGRHRGGHVGFGFDVTDALRSTGDNVVTIRVVDPGTDRTVPRGKQYWRSASEGIFYTRTTGVWQPAWIEAAGAVRIADLRITPDVDRAEVRVEANLVQARRTTPPSAAPLRVRVTAAIDGTQQADQTSAVQGDRFVATLALAGQRLWSPDRPALYDLAIELSGPDGAIDRVESYFGQRKVSLHDGRVYLNNSPYYLRLVLDQGYWPDGILTPPTDDAMQYDIRMTKAFGFNGARKHQKAEDPRWLYHADRLGLLVWGEMANAQDFSPESASRFAEEWSEVIARDYNHPAIVAWVPINESWGVPQILTSAEQQAHAKALYQMTRSFDATRPVVDNDGWEHTEQTDLMTLHDYARTGEELGAKYAQLPAEPVRIPRNGREAMVYGGRYNGAPFVLSEFGGIAFRLGAQQLANEWGYSGVEATRDAFLTRLDGLVKALRANRAWAGFCYTQLTDVEQEINGLMTFDRKPKAEPDVLKRIFAQ